MRFRHRGCCVLRLLFQDKIEKKHLNVEISDQSYLFSICVYIKSSIGMIINNQ